MVSFTHIVSDYSHTPLFVIEREDDWDEPSAVDAPWDPLHSPSSYPSTSSPSRSRTRPPWPESKKRHKQRVMRDMNSSLTMEKERVMCLGIFYQPLHSVQNIGLRRKPSGIPSIVRQDKDIF